MSISQDTHWPSRELFMLSCCFNKDAIFIYFLLSCCFNKDAIFILFFSDGDAKSISLGCDLFIISFFFLLVIPCPLNQAHGEKVVSFSP